MSDRIDERKGDTRTCGSCAHLRVEHRHHGIPGLPETWGRGWCHCCDCAAFEPEPDDDPREFSAPPGSVGER